MRIADYELLEYESGEILMCAICARFSIGRMFIATPQALVHNELCLHY